MRLKTAYREKPAENTPALSVQVEDEPVQPSASVKIDFNVGDKAEPAEPSIGIVSAGQPDEATLALQKQLADLRESERLQREYANAQRMAQIAQQHAQPLSENRNLRYGSSRGLLNTKPTGCAAGRP
jgi:hypothetical protein